MKVSLITSGFPNGFTEDFTDCVKKYYRGGLFVFIASDFNQHEKTDRYVNLFVSMFEKAGIVFDEVFIVDGRISKTEAKKCISKADIVWLSGGDTLKQINSIKENDIIPELIKREGLTIGMSAGSINMADEVVLARDIRENIEETQIYSGIGLVDISIEPHINEADKEHLYDVVEASRNKTIYGLPDNSFIEIADGQISFHGEYIKYLKK